VDEPAGGGRDVDENVRGTDKDSAGTRPVEEPQALVTLTPAEVDRVIERYAEQKVEERAERMVSHDIQSASRNTHHVAMDKLPKSKVVGYRRIVHPELSESGQSCGLCIVASTNMYSHGDLMPIHNLCNCEVAEVYKVGDQLFDPGNLINMEDLEVFYNEAAGSTRGFDLKRSRYKVIDHPEYGRSLVNVNEKASLEAIEFGP
jgi:putative head protein